MAKKSTAVAESATIEEKLKALYDLQTIDSQIDRIYTVRGELPLEVEDLEDELAGLETRLAKLNEESADLDKSISGKKIMIEECNALIKKYKEQQGSVRNNREFEALSKEIEFQELEIQLCEKRIREYKTGIEQKKLLIEGTEARITERQKDLEAKRKELEEIVAETEKEENDLLKKSAKAKKIIDERLTQAYDRIRGNARNGLVVVNVERDACGGCFSKIPPQRQMDIQSHKKIIVCENCGRILVDFKEEEEA